MKNPEFAFAREFGASAQAANILLPRNSSARLVAGAQSQHASLSFSVDLPASVAAGAIEVGSIATLTWADAKTPVAVLGICVGKLFLAVALNPLDVTTRAFMRRASDSGTLRYSVVFDAAEQGAASAATKREYSLNEEALFADALFDTDGMEPGESGRWDELATHAMAHRLLDEGFSARIRERLSPRAFKALSSVMQRESAELAAVC